MEKVIKCQHCPHKWNLSKGGKDPYVCHKCGEDNSDKYINEIHISKEDLLYVKESIGSGKVLTEDLARWFKEKWVDVSKKIDGKHPPCGRKSADGEKGRKGYPKCRPQKKVSKETPKTVSSYSKKEKKSMTAQKRRAEKKDPKPGKGNKPTFTRYDESINESFKVSPSEYSKILNTEDFLLVAPLTHNASCKYGSNTKWCTTKRDDDEDFFDHIISGVLVYLIIKNPEYQNKLNSGKFGLYRAKGNESNESGLVYTDLNEEHSMKWFKMLMKRHDLSDLHNQIMDAYNEYYNKVDNMYKEPQNISLNMNETVEVSYPRLTSLNESKIDISEGLKYHIVTKKPLIENVYKIGSESFNNLLEESRDLYMDGELDLSDEDLIFIMENEYGPIQITNYVISDILNEAEYQGRKVQLGKIMQGDIKKFKVYVKNDKGKVVKVNFGFGGKSAKGKRMVIKKNNPKRRKSFRARMNCDSPGPRWKPRYWACRTW